MKYQEIEGDLIAFAKQGMFDVIGHGCNCFNSMHKGIAPQMAKAFNCNNFDLEHKQYVGDINKLGCIDYQEFYTIDGKVLFNEDYSLPAAAHKSLFVCNLYTQFKYGGKQPFNYSAFNIILTKLNHIFAGKHIGLPQIGAGLGGGDWPTIKSMINSLLPDVQVTIIIYKK